MCFTNAFLSAINNLPPKISGILLKIDAKATKAITEIRLRGNRPIILTTLNGPYFVELSGKLSANLTNNCLYTFEKDMESCFQILCGYSVYSVENCINEGYIPLANGHRAGVCGTAYYNAKNVLCVKNITSINIRIARNNVFECPESIKQLLAQDIFGILIAGAPASGKTTILRSVVSALSDLKKRVCVIDERKELMSNAQNLPLFCDVLDGYPKSVGMLQAIRSLSPEVIICDEIGGVDDAKAIATAANAGVNLIMSAHATNITQLLSRTQSRIVLNTGAFDTVCFLKNSKAPGIIERIEPICLH